MESVYSGKFSVLDYSLFVIVLISSILIGIYHALKARKKPNTKDEYLFGGRKMTLWPVGISLAATSISASTVVGLSAESYAYGLHTWMIAAGQVLPNLLLSYIYLPVFQELKISSTFKYLELRFNRRVRLLGSFIYIVTGLIYMPVVVYVPALAFQKVTGINLYITVIVLTILCASYTAFGGFRAVVWTDVLQLAFMMTGSIVVAIVGIYAAGGITNVWNAADRGGRLPFINLENHNSRSSFIGYVIGLAVAHVYHFGLSQQFIQRTLSLPDRRKMIQSLWIMFTLFGGYVCLSQMLGAIMYANYESCDPLTSGIIRSMDQLLPHFIQEKASLFLGFNGIFIAGVFSGSLSTTSSYLNTMSGIIYEDFLSYRLKNAQENTANIIMKAIVFILGAVQILLVPVVQKMGVIYKITSQCIALNSSALLGLFTLGMLCPKINSKGAQTGALAGILGVGFLIFGGMSQKPEPYLPLRTDGCNITEAKQIFSNITLHDTAIDNEGFSLFRISFLYYGFIGLMLNVSVAYIISLCTGGNTVLDQRLLANFLRKKNHEDEGLEARLNEL